MCVSQTRFVEIGASLLYLSTRELVLSLAVVSTAFPQARICQRLRRGHNVPAPAQRPYSDAKSNLVMTPAA